jgi:hypothetical protein
VLPFSVWQIILFIQNAKQRVWEKTEFLMVKVWCVNLVTAEPQEELKFLNYDLNSTRISSLLQIIADCGKSPD